MSLVEVRKSSIHVEEVWHEGGPRLDAPLRIAVAQAVVRNPYAGRYVEDLMPFMADLKELGLSLSRQLVESIGGADRIEAYGKGAIVGVDGELEHGALWHEAGGWSMREVLTDALAIVPSSTIVGGFGARLPIPLGHKEAAFVRSHFLSAELGLQDGPRPGEIVFGLAMATGGRIHARAGGLRVEQISVRDGQR